MLMEMLDTFIGLITVYLVLSLIVSALGEGTSSWLNFRGRVFRKSIETLLDADAADAFFERDAVKRLQKERLLRPPRLPSYIPDSVIADVIIDLCVNPPPEKPKRQNGTRRGIGPRFSHWLARLRERWLGSRDSVSTETRPSPKDITPNNVDRALRDLEASYAPKVRDLWYKAECDLPRFKTLIAGWFNLTGDRSKGWFKRRLGASLFLIGLVAAIGLNADTLYMFQALSNDASLRASFVDYATDIVNEARSEGIDCDNDECRRLVDRYLADPAPGMIEQFVSGTDFEPTDAEQAQLAEHCGQTGGFEAESCREILRSRLSEVCAQTGGFDAAGCREDLERRLAVRDRACSALGVQGECSINALISTALPEVTPLLGMDLLRAQLAELEADDEGAFWSLKLLGWILTAAAVSLGAPFWFDLLQKVVQIRSSTKPTDTAPAAAMPAAERAPATAAAPRARTVVRAAAADAAALEDLGHFDASTFGFSPLNIFWSARLAQLAYTPDGPLIAEQLEEWGAEGELLDWRDTQCIVARTPRAAFVSFRGTEQKIEDWLSDVKIKLRKPSWDRAAGYSVHTGFDEALDAIWSEQNDAGGTVLFAGLEGRLRELGIFEHGLPIWISGHSLGGALAALGALRLAHFIAQNRHANVIGGIHTFGQPRVGDPACAAALEQAFPARYFRAVNNRDVVPRVPMPRTPDIQTLVEEANERLPPGEKRLEVLDYAHAGRVIYFNDLGKAMMDPPLWYRGLDTLAVGATIEDIKSAAKETVADHGMDGYVRLQRSMLDVTLGEEAA